MQRINTYLCKSGKLAKELRTILLAGGHPDVGQRHAILYSMIFSCESHGKGPLAYLRDVLARLPR